MPNYHWGIVGLGRIAHSFAEQFPTTQTLYGVAARSIEKAQAFAEQYQVPHAYKGYQAMFDDPEIDIIYVATTHNFHYENIKAALLAGKHVLAEKAITLNSRQLDELVAIAAEKHLILMEAQTIYHMPLYPMLESEATSRHLGALKTIQVSFGSHVPFNPEDRLLNPELAGGALLDIGIYALSFARRFMTATPELVATQMVKTSTGVDGQSSFLLTNANNEQVTVALNLQAKMPKQGIVAYEEGYYTVDQYPRSQEATFTKPDMTSEQLQAGVTDQAITYEINDMAKAVETGENPTLVWTREVMAIMTQARQNWHFTYPGETL
ncbi:Gfo/Idh/MocA family protein [Lacticaseibacillus saniviri]